MSPLTSRILAATISGGLAVAAAVICWPLFSDESSIGLVNNTVLAQELLESREKSRLGDRRIDLPTTVPSLAVRGSLTEDEARSIFSIPSHTFLHDGQSFYRYKPNLEEERRWS